MTDHILPALALQTQTEHSSRKRSLGLTAQKVDINDLTRTASACHRYIAGYPRITFQNRAASFSSLAADASSAVVSGMFLRRGSSQRPPNQPPWLHAGESL